MTHRLQRCIIGKWKTPSASDCLYAGHVQVWVFVMIDSQIGLGTPYWSALDANWYADWCADRWTYRSADGLIPNLLHRLIRRSIWQIDHGIRIDLHQMHINTQIDTQIDLRNQNQSVSDQIDTQIDTQIDLLVYLDAELGTKIDTEIGLCIDMQIGSIHRSICVFVYRSADSMRASHLLCVLRVSHLYLYY